MKRFTVPFLLIICLFGCEKYSLAIKKEWLNRDSLASTFVGSPDPLQKHPPKGERLILSWSIASRDLQQNPMLILKVIYHNYTQETKCFPIDAKRGFVTFSLLGEEYRKKGGILTYRAEMEDNKGNAIVSWQQRMWFQLLPLDQELTQPKEE